MAYEESLRSVSLNADSSLAVFTGVNAQPGSPVPNYGHQYTAVKITGVNQVGLATAKATEFAVGVMQNKPQVTGQAAQVAFSGFTNMMAGAAITAGAAVTFDGSGRAITGTLNSATVDGDRLIGVAVTTVTAANTLVVVALALGH